MGGGRGCGRCDEPPFEVFWVPAGELRGTFYPHRVPLNFVLVPLRGWRADRRGLPNAGVSFPSSGFFDGVTY